MNIFYIYHFINNMDSLHLLQELELVEGANVNLQ